MQQIFPSRMIFNQECSKGAAAGLSDGFSLTRQQQGFLPRTSFKDASSLGLLQAFSPDFLSTTEFMSSSRILLELHLHHKLQQNQGSRFDKIRGTIKKCTRSFFSTISFGSSKCIIKNSSNPFLKSRYQQRISPLHDFSSNVIFTAISAGAGKISKPSFSSSFTQKNSHKISVI